MKFPAKFLAAALAAAVLVSGAEISPKIYSDHVKFLASPALRGRGTGTPELDKAAAYLVSEFRKLGLQPPAKAPARQSFQVTINARLGPANRLAARINGQPRALKLDTDFRPFNFSSPSPEISGQAVFAGYGITAPELNYDDYSAIDAKGKVVIILRNEPQQEDEKSIFAGKLLTAHAQYASKASNAKFHGAKALIVVNNTVGEDDLEVFGRTAGPANSGIPVIQVKAAAAEPWFQAAGQDLRALVASIDKDLKPRPFAFPESAEFQIATDIRRESKPTDNVLAYLPGQTSEYIVIGAHYDHLGLGYQFSMAPSQAGQPHLGADDNASGTAGLLELARYFAAGPKPKRGILFIAFSGEELGLLGSGWYVNNPVLPLADCVAMINLDMIGRPRDGRIFVGGVGTGSTLAATLDKAKGRSDLRVDVSQQGGIGSSDHTSFTTKQIPVLFFFSGLHGDYHKPSDTWDKIDLEGSAKVLRLVADVSSQLLEAADRPQFLRVAEPPSRGVSSGGGYGPSFGSIPDFNEPPKGVRFADVRAGSPAAKAGLKAGDILVEFAGIDIQNLQDFTTALRSKKSGDQIEVKILRDGKEMTVRVLLEARR